MPIVNLPTSQVLDIAIRKIPYDTKNYIGARFAPVVSRMAHKIVYDEIHGPVGMTTAHNLDSEASRVAMPGVIRKEFEPGYFKEKVTLKESDLLLLRQMGGTEYQRASAQELTMEALNTINTRIENRVEWLRWQAMIYGAITINENNVRYNATYGVPVENLNRTVSVSWATKTSSKPVEDLLNIQQAFVGSGFSLKQTVMNSKTAGLFCLATDTKTFYGAGIQEKVLPGNIAKHGPTFLPGTEWVVYDGGLNDDSNVFQKFVPDNKIVFLGDAPVGEIIDVVTVPSLHSPGGSPMPGKFAFIIDKTGEKEDNPCVEVVGGIYCLVRIRRPEAIMVMDVTQTSDEE